MKHESHIVGREDRVNDLVSQLIDEEGKCANLSVISVVGGEAIGKTALVRSVCNRIDVKNHFDRFAWVRIGPKPNLDHHLMVDLLKQLRVPKLQLQDVDLMDKEKLSDLLLRVLMECRYLIVLDDLHDLHDAWYELHLMDELMMVLADSRNGSRVIVTTCDPDIPSSIDPWYSEHLELSPLDTEQSNELLEKCSPAFHAIDLPKELLGLKERILSKSGGSPQKILLLGGLSSATPSDRCTELAYLLTTGLPDRPTLQDVVRSSVNDLPEELKQCVLYLTLFPKESEIPTRRLFRLWSAENLVSSVSENAAEECFEILVSRHMVEVARQKWDGSARSCRLPGALYDVFYQMAENERFLKIYDRSIHDEGKFDAPRVAIHRDISGGGEAKVQKNMPEVERERSKTNAPKAHREITPAEPRQKMSASDNSTPCGIQQLCSYVSFNTMKLGTRVREIAVLLKPKAHREITPAQPRQRMSTSDDSMPCGIQQLCSYVSFNTMKLGTQAGEIAVLLEPLVWKRDSSLLRVLDLEGVYKPRLPEELGNILPNLKYLGLRWTLLERLPKSVGLLSGLETFDLKHTNISDLLDSIWEAENLRHLYMTDVNLGSKKSLNCNIQTIWGLCVGAGSDMLEGLGKLTGLRKLALTWTGGALREATKHILNLEMLKCLRLQLRDPIYSTSSAYKLSDMSRLESLSNLCMLGGLGTGRLLESQIPPNLKVLTLSFSRLHVDPMGVLGKLKCLTTLQLFANSYDGQTLSVLEGTFSSLRVLKLWKQHSLTMWTIQVNAMPCLADLEIKECKCLKTIDGLQQIKTLEVITLVRVPDELEQRVRDVQPNVPIIAKNLKKREVQSDEEDEDDYNE